MGVAEQNLVTVASGMAAMGKIPFVTSYAMFSPGRNWEQVRTTIERLLSSPQLLAEMSLAGREDVDGLGCRRISSRLELLLEGL